MVTLKESDYIAMVIIYFHPMVYEYNLLVYQTHLMLAIKKSKERGKILSKLHFLQAEHQHSKLDQCWGQLPSYLKN